MLSTFDERNRELAFQVKRGREKPKKTWKETIKKDMNYLNLNKL